MPVRKREGSPFYQYSFSVRGCRFRGSTGHTDKSKAKEVERDQYQLAKKNLTPLQDWDLQTVLSTYWTGHAKGTDSANDIEAAFANLQRIVGKRKRTSELTSGDLMDYRAKRRGEQRFRKDGEAVKRGPPKAYSINREFAYLYAAYNHCRRHHRQPMPDIDWKHLKAKEPTWRRRFLARENEAPAFLAALPGGAREIVICAIVTGLRQSNVIRLDWSQVNLAERIIAVTAKGKKEHIVSIPPALMAILSTKQKRKGRVFDATNFRRKWEAAVKAAGLENFRFHDLRHTFASWARKAGADLPTLKEALNHSDISMTMRYANVSPDEVRTTFDQVSATLIGTIQGTMTEKVAENREK
jgi:integrase